MVYRMNVDNGDSGFKMNDWMKAIRRPTPYRIGSTSVYVDTRMILKALIGMLLVLTMLVLFIPVADYNINSNTKQCRSHGAYNNTYPLSPPRRTKTGLSYRIAVIADLDTNSKVAEYQWSSYVRRGWLTIEDENKVKLSWDGEPAKISSYLSEKGRGMELSELVAFNGKLYAVDDRTGVVYEITGNNHAVPWVVLQDGDGTVGKGFKAEWATVKDHTLWVGGLGKEWTDVKGNVLHYNPQWVKSIGPGGDVLHHNWRTYYTALRTRTGFLPPGYMIHEAVAWSTRLARWVFMPRRASHNTYEEKADESRATNLLLTADSNFRAISFRHIGPLNPTRGYSSIKFIPGTKESLVVALKSEERDGNAVATYLTVFSMEGIVLLEDVNIGPYKYEGIEFV